MQYGDVSAEKLLKESVHHEAKQHDGCINGCHGIVILHRLSVFTERCRDHCFCERCPERCQKSLIKMRPLP